MNLLITGSSSYIGEHVVAFIQQKEPTWTIYQLDVRTDEWKSYDFSNYDVVFHVAGLAHRKITPDIEPLYYKVNRDLAVEIAIKSKQSGIKHFIFMSTMAVYSDSTTVVDENTPTNPDNAYGKSKLQAEEKISKLSSNDFVVSIIRPPMIYGKGCKGNYNSLRKIAVKSPVFPKVNNKRSMLYIDNLSEFIYQLIRFRRGGVFFPQNAELVNTSEWVKNIAKEKGKDIFLSRLLGWCVIIGMHIPGIKDYCIKAFGDSYYTNRMSEYSELSYQIVSFEESIRKTERNSSEV